MDADNNDLLLAPHVGQGWLENEPSINTTRRLGVAEEKWFHIFAQVVACSILFLLIFGMNATVKIKQTLTLTLTCY